MLCGLIYVYIYIYPTEVLERQKQQFIKICMLKSLIQKFHDTTHDKEEAGEKIKSPETGGKKAC
jgi:hypothetical protein